MIAANISGRLCFDSKEIATKTGKRMVTNRLAVTAGDGTVYVNLTAFNERYAEWLSRCIKGDRLSCMGDVSLNEWTDKASGEKRQALQMVIDGMLCNAPKPKAVKHG